MENEMKKADGFFFFFQNNTNFQIILLVSIISKPFKKLTSQILKTRLYCNNSSITYSIFMKIHVELESVRLKFHKKKTQKSKLETHKHKKQNQSNEEEQNHSCQRPTWQHQYSLHEAWEAQMETKRGTTLHCTVHLVGQLW